MAAALHRLADPPVREGRAGPAGGRGPEHPPGGPGAGRTRRRAEADRPGPHRRGDACGVAAGAAVALAAAGLAWWAGGGRGGSEVVLGRADTAVVAPGAGTRNGSDSSPVAGSAPEDPASEDSTPEAVEAALGLDRAGWRRIQEGLAALGLDPGAPDGLVGGRTRRAVRAYQAGAGKPATGFLDAADLETLQHAASEAAAAERQRLAEAHRRAAAAERQRLAEARRRRAAELCRGYTGKVYTRYGHIVCRDGAVVEE